MPWATVIIIRLLVPLSILRWPLFGSALSIIVDNLDVVILDYLGIKNYDPYNRMDKFMDTYMYFIQGYTVLYWKSLRAKYIALFLLGYRFIGAVLYEITDLRFLLLVFPNVFLWFYLFVLIFAKFSTKNPFKKVSVTVLIVGGFTVGKVFHEYVLHSLQYPIYSFVREHILTKIIF